MTAPGTTWGPHESHERYRTSANDNNVLSPFRAQIGSFPQVSEEHLHCPAYRSAHHQYTF
jgi:hypothetical protein